MKVALILVFVSFANGQNGTNEGASSGQTQSQCGQQIDTWQMCLMKDVPRSTEGKLLKDKIDGIYDKCAGSMPKNCTSFWRGAGECFERELEKVDGDSESTNLKRRAQQNVDQCFQRTPNDPFADLFVQLYPEMQLFDDGGAKAPQEMNLGGKRFVPPPQCAPTMDNLQCVSKEISSMTQDNDAKKAAASLRKLKQNCDEKLPPECKPQSPPLFMCMDRAMKQINLKTEEAIQKCMQQKGFTLVSRQPMVPPQFPGFGFSPFGQQQMPGQMNFAGMPMANMPFMGAGGSFPGQGQPQPSRMQDSSMFDNHDWFF